MERVIVKYSQNGGEYYGNIFIKGDNLDIKEVSGSRVVIGNIEIEFENEYIDSVKQENI